MLSPDIGSAAARLASVLPAAGATAERGVRRHHSEV